MIDQSNISRIVALQTRPRSMPNWLTAIRAAGFAVAIAFFCAQATYAIEPTVDTTQITMSPTSTRLELMPGSSQKGEITVVNSGKKAYTFNVYAAPYAMNDSAYSQPDFTHPSDRTLIASWITFEKDSYLLEAGQTLTVPYTIQVPQDLPGGGQYGVIFAETEGEVDTTSGNAVVSKKRVGMVLYAQVPGAARIDGSVDAFSTQWLQMDQSPVFRHTVTNSGNTHFDATVSYSVEDLGGKQIASDKITSVVLPDTTRAIELAWKNTPSFGLYNVTRTVSFLDTTESSKQLVLRVTPLFGLIILAVIVCGIGGVGYAIYRVRSSRRRSTS